MKRIEIDLAKSVYQVVWIRPNHGQTLLESVVCPLLHLLQEAMTRVFQGIHGIFEIHRFDQDVVGIERAHRENANTDSRERIKQGGQDTRLIKSERTLHLDRAPTAVHSGQPGRDTLCADDGQFILRPGDRQKAR